MDTEFWYRNNDVDIAKHRSAANARLIARGLAAAAVVGGLLVSTPLLTCPLALANPAPYPIERPDSDQDGLFDDDEANVYNTDANDPDTDGDGAEDGEEVFYTTDPLVPEDDQTRPEEADAEDGATGPGEEQPEEQPEPEQPAPPQPAGGDQGGAVLNLVNDARLHPEKYPPRGNTAGARMAACVTPFQNFERLSAAAATHNSYLATQPIDWVNAFPNMHKNADGKLSWDNGGIIDQAGYHSYRAEIVATGFPTAAEALRFWMQDDAPSQWGHRNAILNCTIHEAGAAHLAGGPGRHYWTVDMGNP